MPLWMEITSLEDVSMEDATLESKQVEEPSDVDLEDKGEEKFYDATDESLSDSDESLKPQESPELCDCLGELLRVVLERSFAVILESSFAVVLESEDTMSDQGHRVKLTVLKSLLRATGVSREDLPEAMADYEAMDDVSLDSAIDILGRGGTSVCPREGTSSRPHTGVETSSHAVHTTVHRTPIPGTSHHESQRLTLDVSLATQVTLDSQASGRQSRRSHR
ncbi:hypothetical protein L7F22_016516 [Adiantum nelumboides]|nr:hypothetical protein [Adiantum nelumboides]